MVVDVCKRLAVCEARMSQALSLRAKFVKDFETVKGSAIPGDEEETARHMAEFVRALTTGGGGPAAEVAVIGASRGPAGQLIRRMFLEAKRSLHMITDDFEAASSNDTGMMLIRSVIPGFKLMSLSWCCGSMFRTC